MIDSQCSIVKLRNISSRRLGEVVFEDVNASINADAENSSFCSFFLNEI